MRVSFHTDSLQPMLDWLMTYKTTGTRDEAVLRRILSMPDYQVEFARYSMEGLPVCGIGFEEAVDFFLHFDTKDFENPRLQSKKASFLAFFRALEERTASIREFSTVAESDMALMEELLRNGLPDAMLAEIGELGIILIVSIGNSMGWPYENYIDYDVASLNQFAGRDDFLHVTAHEIHHILLGGLLGAVGIRSEDFFLQNFAYEGLAVHFNNNQGTLMKSPKYSGPVYGMQQEDMDFYEANFDTIFAMIRADYEMAKNLPLEEIPNLVSEHYEIFTFLGKPVKQYPTYYFGCYLWGLVDLRYGKEKLFEAIANPPLFVQLYNHAAAEKYRLG